MAVAETSLVPKNHQIPHIVRQKINQLLIEKVDMTAISNRLGVSTTTVLRQLKQFNIKTDLTTLPEVMSWDEYSFMKGKMSFIAQEFESGKLLAILDGRTHAVIRNHFLRYPRTVRNRVKIDMFSPYYALARKLFPNAEIVLDRFHIVQHLSRAMNRIRIQIMKQFNSQSKEYKALKRYWKLILKDSSKLSHKRFYQPMFKQHLTSQEILTKLLGYSQELKEHYDLYQLLLFHFQNKDSQAFFGLIEDTIENVNDQFKTVFKTFLKDRDKVENALNLPYSNARLEATNNIIKVIKRMAFCFRNFENFRTHIFIALNTKREKTKLVSLSMLD